MFGKSNPNQSVTLNPYLLFPLEDILKSDIYEKIQDLKIRTHTIEDKINENQQILNSKIVNDETRRQKQVEALEEEQKLKILANSINDQIIGLEKLIKQTSNDNTVDESDLDQFESFVSLELNAMLAEKAKKLADAEKSSLGKSDLSIRLENLSLEQKRLQNSINSMKKERDELKHAHDQYKSQLGEAKITQYGADLNQLETQLNIKQVEAKQLANDKLVAESKLTECKKQREVELSKNGKIKIEVSSGAGPLNPENRSYISINGKKTEDCGKRGLQLAFINSRDGSIRFNKSYDTHEFHTAMTNAAEDIKQFKDNAELIAIFIAADEVTDAGGFSHGSEHHGLIEVLESMGSDKFSGLRYRNGWYFVKGPGIKDGKQEDYRNYHRKEEKLHLVPPPIISDAPYSYIEKKFDQDEAEISNNIISLTNRITNTENNIVDIKKDINNLKESLAIAEANKNKIQNQINLLDPQLSALNTSLSLFEVELANCLKQQEQLNNKAQNLSSNPVVNEAQESKIDPEQLETLQLQLTKKRAEMKSVQESLIKATHRVNQLISPPSEQCIIPLTVAVLSQNIDMIELVLTCKPNVNQVDQYGWTALHYAVAKACSDNLENSKIIIRLLLQNGAKISIPNYDENYPTEVAVISELKEYVLYTALEINASQATIDEEECATILFALDELYSNNKEKREQLQLKYSIAQSFFNNLNRKPSNIPEQKNVPNTEIKLT